MSDALFFLSDLHVGGAQRTIINLVRHWPKDRPNPTLAVACAVGDGRSWIDGIAAVHFGCARLRQAFFPLRRLIRREKPNIVFSTMVHANIVAAASIVGLRNPPIFVARETNSHRARGDLSLAQRVTSGRVYRRADAVVALSEGIRRELIEDYRLEPGRVITIHNPVDIDDFRSRAACAVRPWQGEGPVVVAAGRLVRQKGYDILLRAFADMRAGNSRLAILGDGPERGMLWKLADKLGVVGRLILPGHVADSEYCRNHFAPGATARVHVILDPVRPPCSARDHGSYRDSLLEAAKAPPGTDVIIGYVANFIHRKRPLVFVEIAARLRDQFGNGLFFPMFGETDGVRDKSLKHEVTAKIAEHGLTSHCVLMGPRFPIEPWLMGCDALVAPAVREGFGRTLVEAMLCDTPIVAADEGGHKEIILHGETGLLARADDVAAFVNAVAELHQQPRMAKAIAAAANADALATYSVETHVERIQSIYDSLLR